MPPVAPNDTKPNNQTSAASPPPVRSRLTLKSWVLITNITFLSIALVISGMILLTQGDLFAYLTLGSMGLIALTFIPMFWFAVAIAGLSGVSAVVLNAIYFTRSISAPLARMLTGAIVLILNAPLFYMLAIIPVILLK